MELLLGIAVIFILLLCLGASVELIISVALGIIGLFIVFMALIFIYAFVVMIASRKTAGKYACSREDEKSRILFAYYIIDGVEYKNMFPMEVIFQKLIYKEQRQVKLLLNEKRKRCFDNNAVICCILGIIVSVFLIFEMIMLISGNL